MNEIVVRWTAAMSVAAAMIGCTSDVIGDVPRDHRLPFHRREVRFMNIRLLFASSSYAARAAIGWTMAVALAGCGAGSPGTDADRATDAFASDASCASCVDAGMGGERDASGLDAWRPIDAGTVDAAPACGPVEVCDGTYDEDCDLAVDEDCTCSPGTQVPLLDVPFYFPDDLDVTPSGFAVAGSGTDEDVFVYLADHTFERATPLVVIPGATFFRGRAPRIAVQGEDIGVLNQRDGLGTYDAWFTRVSSATGTLLSTPANVGQALVYDLARGPTTGFAMTYRNPATDVGVRMLSPDGVPLASGASARMAPNRYAIAIGGAGIVGVAYPLGEDVGFQRFDTSAAPLGAEVVLVGGPRASEAPSISGDAHGWWIAWAVDEDLDTWPYRVAHVDATGTLDVSPRVVARSAPMHFSVEIAADGTGGAGVLFGSEGGAHFQRLDATGTAVGSETLIRLRLPFGGLVAYDGTRFVGAIAAGVGCVLVDLCVPR